MLNPVTLFYAALCALTFWVTLHSRPGDRFDAMLAAAVLTTGCLLSNIAWVANSIGDWVKIDAGVMLLLLWILWRTPQRWKIVLASLAVLTMGVHAVKQWSGDDSVAMLYAYPAVLNAIFFLELLCVASNGVRGARDHGSVWLVFTWPRLHRNHARPRDHRSAPE